MERFTVIDLKAREYFAIKLNTEQKVSENGLLPLQEKFSFS